MALSKENYQKLSVAYQHEVEQAEQFHQQGQDDAARLHSDKATLLALAMNEDAPQPGGLGTCWVADGEGSTWGELTDAFRGFGHANYPLCQSESDAMTAWVTRTNLKLTGQPLTQYDRQRWESGNVR